MQSRSSRQVSEDPAAWEVRVGVFSLTETKHGVWRMKRIRKDSDLDPSKSLLDRHSLS